MHRSLKTVESSSRHPVLSTPRGERLKKLIAKHFKVDADGVFSSDRLRKFSKDDHDLVNFSYRLEKYFRITFQDTAEKGLSESEQVECGYMTVGELLKLIHGKKGQG